MDNKVLGKGLSVLIPSNRFSGEDGVDSSGEKIRYLETKSIGNNSLQPRSYYDPEKLNDLKISIKDKGMLQPILVREKDDGYEVVAGERRLRVARDLDLPTVPAIIKILSDKDTLIIALIENIQREDLGPIEEAEGYSALIEKFHYTQDQVAQSVGKKRSTITNMLRLLKLPTNMKTGLSSGLLSTGHARALLGLVSEKVREQFYQLTINKGISVRVLEKMIREEVDKSLGRKRDKPKEIDPEIKSLEERLQGIIGTKVRVEFKKKKGRIIIEYYSLDDLDRIIGMIEK